YGSFRSCEVLGADIRWSTAGRANGTGGRYGKQRRFLHLTRGTDRDGPFPRVTPLLSRYSVASPCLSGPGRSYDKDMTTKTVEFTRMADGTREEYQYLH